MDVESIFTALGGVAALVAAGSIVGKAIVERFADGTLKRFEHSLSLNMEVHKAELARQAELHKSYVGFSTTVDVDLRERRVAVYDELWRTTELVSRWPRNLELKYEEISDFFAPSPHMVF